MHAINIGSIMKKVDAWTKTEEGKRRIREVLDKYQANGITKTAAGDTIISYEDMVSAANTLIKTIISFAENSVPESVLENIKSIHASPPRREKGGTWYIDLNFSDDLGRDSLYEKGYPEGISNIIAIFNQGYQADGVVYGMWRGIRYKSLQKRDGAYFLQRAIEDFNNTEGSRLGVSVQLAEIYQ